MKKFALFLLVLACSPPKEYQSEGELINDNNVISTAEFLTRVGAREETYKIRGVVEEVCRMKGCWLTLKNDAHYNVRVTFKDYGFFVPKDISGKEVILEGVAFKELLDDETARHYAEDADEAYTESDRNQISFIAKGVLIEQS